jgi:hypothetical protein
MPTETKPSIVFVHGIWADGSSVGSAAPPSSSATPTAEPSLRPRGQTRALLGWCTSRR